MTRERKVINSCAYYLFNKDVKASELNKVAKDFQRIFVTGNVNLDESLCICSQLYVTGNIISENEFDNDIHINAENGLWCYGKIKATNINVCEYLLCNDIVARSVKIAGDIYLKQGTIYTQKGIDIAGDLSGEGNIITRDGNIHIYGNIELIGTIEPTMYNLCAKAITSKAIKIMGASQIKIGY